MATNRAPSTAAALNCRSLPGGGSRAVLGRDTTAIGDSGATSERGTFLAEDAAVGPAASSGAHGATASSTGRDAAANPGCGSAAASMAAQAGPTRNAAASLAAQTGPTRNGGSRGLRRRVASQRGAVATQDVGAAFATDAQSSAAGGTSTTLTTDADTPERTRHVRSSSTVQRSAFTSDQPRLTARAGTHRCVATRAGEPADIAGASQPGARGDTGLTSQTATASQPNARTKTTLAS
jgi:hypothetical protein